MRIRVLGPVEVETPGGEPVRLVGAKMRGLLGVLALEAGVALRPQRLVEAVWGDDAQNGPNVLQVTVSKLRRALADAGLADLVQTVPAGYQLLVDRDEVDALVFGSLVDQAGEAHDPDQLIELLTRALGLWRGDDVLADAPDTALIGAIRAGLAERRHLAVEDLVDARLVLGRHRSLVPEIEAMVAAEPLRERRWGQLMRALYGSDQQAEALRAYQRAREVLIDEMGVEPSAELRRLEAAVLAQDEELLGVVRSRAGGAARGATAGPVGHGFRRRGNVRHPIAACIGRDREVAHLDELSRRHRLVTLTGLGGVGKTRLAQELAIRLVPEAVDGVWWVDLAPARDDLDVVAGLQRAIQVEPAGGEVDDELAELASVLEDRSATVVLDNCEHLLGAVDRVVAELLGRCGDVRVIATSRVPIEVPGEAVFPVAPLGLAEAVTLFEDRVGAAPGTVDAGDAISQICERVDRLPLAVELAAARARHLSLSEILERLNDRFELLRTREADADDRRGDLRAVADWSYNLLDEPDRIVFERLSVFADGATLDAASAVCADEEVDAGSVEATLERLVDRSLVYVDRSGPTARYRMLQTLADYARDRLVERGTEPAARLAHARWVLDLAATVDFGARTTGRTIAAVQAEDVAVRDAVAWAAGADPLLALDVCTRLGPFWFGTMRVSTGWDLLSAALDAAGDADLARRDAALVWAIVFRTMVFDSAGADRLAEEAWPREQARGDPERLGRLAFARALAAGYRSDGDPRPWVAEASARFEATGSQVGLGHLRFAEGAAALVTGDLEGGRAGLTEAADAFRRHPDHLGLILAVSRLGEVAWRVGDLEAFGSLHDELLRLGRESSAPGVITGATARLALARLLQGDLDEAVVLADAAVAGASETFMAVVNGYVFKSAGLVNLALGHADEGRDQLRVAIDAFGRGAGDVGTGLAATCWLDLSRSFDAAEAPAEAVDAADRGCELARASGDPWVIDLLERHRAALAG